tara:strand:+ start:257 stop:1144 length:888 start_codon:yes stop_codon:yes gene_type:complete
MRYNAATGMFELEEGDAEAQFAAVPTGDFSKYKMSTFNKDFAPSGEFVKNNEPIFKNPGAAELEPTFAGDYGSVQYGDNKFDIMQYLPFGEKSVTGSIIRGIGSLVPDMDPRQKALRDLYGYTNTGSVPTGLMQGYNPVSGGGLYTLTGGKFGEPPTYGLQKAYDKRRATIEKTLTGKKYGLSQDDIDAIYAGTYDEESDNLDTALIQRLRDLKAMQDKELEILQGIQPTGGTTTTTTNITSDPGDGGGAVFTAPVTTKGGDTYAAGDYSDVARTLADPREKMDYYKDGGLASIL